MQTAPITPIDAPAGTLLFPDSENGSRIRMADDGPAVLVGRRAFRRAVLDGYEFWASVLLDQQPGDWPDWTTSGQHDPDWRPEPRAHNTRVWITVCVDVDPYMECTTVVEAKRRDLPHRGSEDACREALVRLLPKLPKRGVTVTGLHGLGDGRWSDRLVDAVIAEAHAEVAGGQS